MIVIVSLLLGVAIGVLNAKKRKGNRLDMLQFAAGYGIAFTILGVFITLGVDRLAG